jgi:hypothetical protein
MSPKRYDKSSQWRDKSPGWRYQAAIRVGRTPRERLAWLLEFAQQRPAIFATNGKARRQATDEIGHFTLGGGVGLSGRLDLLSVIDLEGFAIFVLHGLSSLRERDGWELRLLPLQRLLQNKPVSFVRQVRRESEGRIETRYLSSDVLMTARWRAQELVAENLNSIGVCPRPAPACGRYFVINKRQKYCSGRCSGIERQAKLRTKLRRKDPERARILRHEAYKRKVAREKGPAVAKKVRTRIKEAASK